MNTTETNASIAASALDVGDKLFDPTKAGTHAQRVEVQWLGHHRTRQRTYIAGVEEHSRNPVQLAYNDDDVVKIFREEHRP